MFTLSFAKIGQLVPQFQSRKRSKWTAWWSQKTTVFVLSVATKETVLLNAGHITHVTAIVKNVLVTVRVTNWPTNVRRRATRSKYHDTVHPLNLSDFCNNTYCHSVLLVVLVVVDFIFATATAASAATATATTTTAADVEIELHKLLPCNTTCKAAPRRSDVTGLQHLHGFFKRKRKGRRKEGMTEDNTRHTGKTEQKRAKEKEHGTAQHTLYQLTQYICIHLRPLRLVTINPTAVLWYCRLFSFNHDSSRTRWALSRRNPPPMTLGWEVYLNHWSLLHIVTAGSQTRASIPRTSIPTCLFLNIRRS